MSFTGPPTKQARVSSNDNNNSSSSARNTEQLSSQDEQFLTKEERLNNEYFDYFDKTLTDLLMQQKTTLELNGEMWKKLQQRESECAKLTQEIQQERLRRDQQIKEKNNEISLLRKQLAQMRDRMTKFHKRCLDVNTSDTQCDANRGSVASHLLTSHPSAANAVQNNNVVIASPSMPDLNESNKFIDRTTKESKKRLR
ncbi:PREDICTED: nucleoprotein TPR-like [Wasmannia auropunctata]|uniref:nucleoprotein TPR-like n=1 Tax=Wasmannia auropunctata TaxID=64793 RepID=UPI0005EE97A2|nr:PREDICTED: nucleoprotein TPR-like [Wasmannia auropunctata]